MNTNPLASVRPSLNRARRSSVARLLPVLLALALAPVAQATVLVSIPFNYTNVADLPLTCSNLYVTNINFVGAVGVTNRFSNQANVGQLNVNSALSYLGGDGGAIAAGTSGLYLQKVSGDWVVVNYATPLGSPGQDLYVSFLYSHVASNDRLILSLGNVQNNGAPGALDGPFGTATHRFDLNGSAWIVSNFTTNGSSVGQSSPAITASSLNTPYLVVARIQWATNTVSSGYGPMNFWVNPVYNSGTPPGGYVTAGIPSGNQGLITNFAGPTFRFNLAGTACSVSRFLVGTTWADVVPPTTASAQYASGSFTWDNNGTAKWSATSGGPYTSKWVSGNNAFLEGAPGTVTLSSPTVNTITFNSSGYTLSGASTLALNAGLVTLGQGYTATIGNNTATVIAGANGLHQSQGTLTLNGSAVHTFTGGLTEQRGTLNLDLSNLATPTDLINSNNALTLAGELNITGKSSGASSQTFAATGLSEGGSTIGLNTNGSGSLTVNLRTISRASGATITFPTAPSTSGIVALTANATVNGLLGTWATIGSGTNTSYATTNDLGQIVAAATTASGESGWSDSTANYVADAQTLTGPREINSYTGAGPGWGGIDLAGNELALNGLLAPGPVGSALTVNDSVGGGYFHIGSQAELVLSGPGDITISAQTCNYGATPYGGTPGVLTVAGPGTYTLAGINNTYINGFNPATRINGGVLEVSVSDSTNKNYPGVLGLIPSSWQPNVVLSGGTLKAVNLTTNRDWTVTISNYRQAKLAANTVNTLAAATNVTFYYLGSWSDETTGGALTLAGPGTVIISGSHIFSGGTTLLPGAHTAFNTPYGPFGCPDLSCGYYYPVTGTFGIGPLTLAGGDMRLQYGAGVNTNIFYIPLPVIISGDPVFGWSGENTNLPIVFTTNATLTGGSHSFTVNALIEFAGAIGDGGKGYGLTLSNAPALGNGVAPLAEFTLSGANTYTGPTTVSAGRLKLSGSVASTSVSVAGGTLLLTNNGVNHIGNSAPVTLGGGTGSAVLALAGTLTETVNTLAVSGTNHAAIDFAYAGHTGSSTLTFADSHLVAWANSVVISNYNGTVNHLFVGASASGLTAAQLAAISFADPAGSPAGMYNATQNSSGEVLPGSLIVPASTPPNFEPGGISYSAGTVSLTATGALSATYKLWASTNVALALSNWTQLTSGTITTSPFTVTDTGAATNSQRFYRFSAP